MAALAADLGVGQTPEMRTVLIGLVFILSGPVTGDVPPTKATALEIRRAEYEQRPGHVAIKDPFGATYFMSPRVELTDADVKSAEFLPAADGRPRIKLVFSRQGALKFADLTRTHLKRPLVFLIQGRVAMVPFVNEVASGEFTWIEGLVKESDAKALQAVIAKRNATVQ